MNAEHNGIIPTSYWIKDTHLPNFPSLSKDITVDVGVVGGGITGITTAYLLAKEGYKVAILEADELVKGTTGHTTAKITAQHDIIYHELLQHLGKEKARQYYKSNSEALTFIKQLVEENQIDCDFADEDAFIYANTDKGVKDIEKEAEAYKELGIAGGNVDKLPIDIYIKAGIVMEKQAQFHPLRYLSFLIDQLKKMDVQIYEHTVANDVEEGEHPTIVTKAGSRITCSSIVSCSHFPFYDGKALYFSRMYAERSYIIGVKTKTPVTEGMYLSADEPKRSIRTATADGDSILLIGGESHKTGQGGHTSDHFDALQQFADEHFTVDQTLYQWGAQDLITLDKVPYIGRLTSSHDNIYVATGYRKWGMTNGTAAAILISNLIKGKKSLYEDLYTPSRFLADPSIKHFLKENLNVAKEFVKGKVQAPQKKVEDLQNNEGDLVFYDNQRAGAYKNDEGSVHVVDTTCTHLGCEVEWNNGEKTWDCPCHGSRFSVTGEVLEGPADQPLKKLL
ncbi:FAD-dependent oxidoreductase [Pontibacillus yanchengensis]|uniref:FAD-dependent oxidoreductase n=1 Tax=Pontibacillus yanchengensis TaxID=462910 RepID=A0A6I5A6S0_9BACI|nr:FAD-dependent oxidoreductase [Pontibacillus yanchengensis]MYL36007.1 FAD-dependent oxidoreductase [Pontibacillus yanchengensis]